MENYSPIFKPPCPEVIKDRCQVARSL